MLKPHKRVRRREGRKNRNVRRALRSFWTQDFWCRPEGNRGPPCARSRAPSACRLLQCPLRLLCGAKMDCVAAIASFCSPSELSECRFRELRIREFKKLRFQEIVFGALSMGNFALDLARAFDERELAKAQAKQNFFNVVDRTTHARNGLVTSLFSRPFLFLSFLPQLRGQPHILQLSFLANW